MKKSIAFLIYDTSLTGGAEVITRQLALELVDTYEVTIISLFQEKKCVHDGYHHVVISESVVSIHMHIWSLSKSVKRVVKEMNVDILFSVTAGVNSVAALATWHTFVKTVFVEHSNLMNQTYGKKHFYRQKIGAKKMDCTVTLTQKDKENYIRIFNMNPEQIKVIPNWFEETKTETQYDSDSKKIITAGRLAKVKGYDTLLEVASKVLVNYPKWTWDIYGDGDERAAIEEAIRRCQLQEQVILKGQVSNLSELYGQYALFVMCSYYEGLPLVLLEAQTAHLPLVSFDCQTGPGEIILDNVNGVLIEERDTDQMAQEICKLLGNPELRTQYASHARDGMQRFRKDVILQEWKQLIEEL